MTIEEFNKLPEYEQIKAVWNSGIAIGKRSQGVYNFVLYHFDTFYVETTYPFGYYNIKKIQAFEPDSVQLELYIDNIDISKIKKDL
jgi:hypothetical protein